MSRSIFGWSLPPGVTSRMIDEAYGTETPCDVCGGWPDPGPGATACICPECPVCGSFGDPKCYRDEHEVRHGLYRTKEQTDQLAREQEKWAAYEREMEERADIEIDYDVFKR